jgi:thiol-disulfide isomerase/thioredoxin
MSTGNEREEQAFRAVYAVLIERVREAPTIEELQLQLEERKGVRTGQPGRRVLALTGAGLFVALVVIGLVLFPLTTGTPSALATLQDARAAFDDLPAFRATFTGRITGTSVAEELGVDTAVDDRVYVDEIWHRGDSGWRLEVVSDSVPEFSGGAGSVTVWDGDTLTAYRADENTYWTESDPAAELVLLHHLDPDLISWPLITGDALPSEEYFTEHCEVIAESELAGRAARQLSCEDGRVQLWLDQVTGLLLKSEGPFGGHELTHIEFEPEFPADIFAFEPPPGSRSAEEAEQDPYTHVGLVRGEPAPPWESRLLDGSPILLRDLIGKPALILLWADWCEPCLASLPLLGDVHDRHIDVVNIVAVAIHSTAEAAEKTVVEGGYSFPVAVDTECAGCSLPGVSDAWDVQSFPIWVLLDRDGRVHEVQVGPEPDFAGLDRLLAEAGS